MMMNGTMIVVIIAVLLVVFVSANISKVRSDKRQLEELNEFLERAGSIAEDGLRIAENANKSKSHFLSNMSHDMIILR